MGRTDTRPSQILVFTTDLLLRTTIRDLLIDEGFSVLGAANFVEVSHYLATHQVDLALSDLGAIRSGDPGGIERLKELADGVPVVVLTARGKAGELSPAAFGVADVIPKPFESDDLVHRLRVALDRFRLRRVNRDRIIMAADLGPGPIARGFGHD